MFEDISLSVTDLHEIIYRNLQNKFDENKDDTNQVNEPLHNSSKLACIQPSTIETNDERVTDGRGIAMNDHETVTLDRRKRKHYDIWTDDFEYPFPPT